MTLREGEEGAGSGHDRPGGCELRMDGGPLRYWVMAGTPARVLHGLDGADRARPRCRRAGRWATSTPAGASAASRRCGGSSAGYRERGLPLSALHLDIDHYDGHRVFTVDRERFPDLPGLAAGVAARTGCGWCRSSIRR